MLALALVSGSRRPAARVFTCHPLRLPATYALTPATPAKRRYCYWDSTCDAFWHRGRSVAMALASSAHPAAVTSITCTVCLCLLRTVARQGCLA